MMRGKQSSIQFAGLLATALDEMRRQLDAQMMQTGDGVIGTVTTDTPAGGSNVIALTTDGFGARLMRYGQTSSGVG